MTIEQLTQEITRLKEQQEILKSTISRRGAEIGNLQKGYSAQKHRLDRITIAFLALLEEALDNSGQKGLLPKIQEAIRKQNKESFEKARGVIDNIRLARLSKEDVDFFKSLFCP